MILASRQALQQSSISAFWSGRGYTCLLLESNVVIVPVVAMPCFANPIHSADRSIDPSIDRAEECYKFVHDDAKLGRFFEEDAKLVLRKEELMEKRDRLSKANAAMANIQVGVREGGIGLAHQPQVPFKNKCKVKFRGVFVAWLESTYTADLCNKVGVILTVFRASLRCP